MEYSTKNKFTNPLPLSETLTRLREGSLGLKVFLSSICDRIEAVEPYVHSLLPEQNRRERLLSNANDLMRKCPDPHNRPPLFGIPVGVKDIFNVDGFETSAGSQLPTSLFKGKESSVVTQLKANGALILGKTVSTEFAYFEPGNTRNPHNIYHTPGGSSSGSAAAVACGISPLALGTQTIGSVSRPASYCGVFGFKPTLGRIPTDGIVPFSPTSDHVGFFTQDFDGVEIACLAMVPHWISNSINPNQKPVIGVATGSYLQQADANTILWFNSRIKLLEDKGYTIVEVDAFGKIDQINQAHRSMVAYDFARVHEKWFAKYESKYRPHSKNLVLEGQNISDLTWRMACDGRDALRNKVENIQNERNIDIWLSPSALGVAPKGLESTGSPLMNLPWTYIGVPTLSIPTGLASNRLPMGLQVAGTFGKDEMLIEFCKILEIDISEITSDRIT